MYTIIKSLVHSNQNTLDWIKIMQNLQSIIEAAYEERSQFTPKNMPQDIKDAINAAISLLNSGKARVAEKANGTWHVNEWLKKAVLLFFRLNDNTVMNGQFTHYFDKVPLKFNNMNQDEFTESGIRVVPPAVARYGAYLAPNTILMPSY